MNSNIESYEGYDPIKDTSLLNPVDTKEFDTNLIRYLYREEHLTQDEFVVLDFLGATTLVKDGNVTMSFQGLKRLISLHQARLTKAVNRLINKNLIEKTDAGYTITKKGQKLFHRLFKEYRNNDALLPNKLYSHVAKGSVQGPQLTKNQYEKIIDSLVGRWFGKFRFTTKIDYENSFEICWISTDGSISASLIVGPENNLRLSLSAPMYSESQNELQILINHVSQSLESTLDAPVVINNYSVYENRKKLSQEVDNVMIKFAG